MISGKEEFFALVDEGRQGHNIGLPIGFPKLELYTDGYLPGTSYLIGASSGVGCNFKTAVPIEESLELLQTNIGEDCDVNTEITIEIKESVALYSVDSDTNMEKGFCNGRQKD